MRRPRETVAFYSKKKAIRKRKNGVRTRKPGKKQPNQQPVGKPLQPLPDSG